MDAAEQYFHRPGIRIYVLIPEHTGNSTDDTVLKISRTCVNVIFLILLDHT